LIDEEKRAGIAYDEQILQATIFEIGEQRAGSGIKDSDGGFFRHIFERAVAAVSVEAVWQARRLTDVEVVETVVVEISCSDAVVAVNVDAGSAVENSAPVIRAVAKLVLIRRAIGKKRLRDVEEQRRVRLGDRFFDHLPLVRDPAG